MGKKYQTWNEFFKDIQTKDYSKSLHEFLDKEYASKTCYPPRKLVFNAFSLTPLKETKVIIFGQDPYHEPNQAMGLAFSVMDGVQVPPSLINIYKEIENEYHCVMNYHSGDLTYLAKQGVLLLNSILSVERAKPLSHNIEEYAYFFEDVLKVLNDNDQPMVFLLWGSSARKFKKYLTNPNHLILESVHPSPLSANRGGWFGNNHFKTTNEFLKKHNLKEIEWCNLSQDA